MTHNKQIQGRVIASHGRHYMIEMPDGQLRKCFPRGKRSEVAVGDNVIITPSGQEEGTIEKTLERRNLLYRSDDMRSKQFAANVDQLLIVIATEPSFSDELAGRALVAAWSTGIKPFVVLNKVDLTARLEMTRSRLAWLQPLNVPVIELIATDIQATRDTLLPQLHDHCSLLLGQSAMGKSTILNALVPDANAHTQEHSQALGAGKHTTTSTRLYPLPAPYDGAIIDSPGFQSFGLFHLDAQQIQHGFPEFGDSPEHCRFHNCTHRHEPGCAVLERLEQGHIAPQRYELYQRLMAEYESKTLY